MSTPKGGTAPDIFGSLPNQGRGVHMDDNTDTETDTNTNVSSAPTHRSDGGWVLLTDLKLRDGRLQVLKRTQERHGLAGGDIVEAVLRTGDGEEINIGERPITQKRRITVPSHVRAAHSLEEGYMDVWVKDTGLRLE